MLKQGLIKILFGIFLYISFLFSVLPWDRFDFVFTSKHGSWLNILIGQCLNRRIDNLEEVRRETTAVGWQGYRNNRKVKVNWSFTADDAE